MRRRSTKVYKLLASTYNPILHSGGSGGIFLDERQPRGSGRTNDALETESGAGYKLLCGVCTVSRLCNFLFPLSFALCTVLVQASSSFCLNRRVGGRQSCKGDRVHA